MPPDQQKPPLALIVDDDPVLRLLAREALESSGWNVAEAENGREALATFQRLHPDVVLLDIMMPEMDGFTACAALRQLPEGEHAPIIIMTGLEDYSSVMRAYDAGATDFLTKPLNGPLLTHRVRYIVRSSRALQDLRASQVSLAQSERRLRFTQFAVDHAEDGILWVDDSKRCIYANEAACRLMGYANEELLTLSISDIAPYLDPTRFQQRIDQIKEGTAATYESVHRRKDGTEFPIEASVTILKHEGQGYICAIIRDITERKHIEEERLQALVAIENIMETVPDIMFTLDRQGSMVKWNRRVEEVTGYSPEELLGMPALAFVPAEEQTRTAAAIQRAFTEGYAELEGQLLTKEHRLIPYHWTGALLKNPHGEPIGITGIGRDVSDKKRMEEALQRQRRHLVDAQAIAHLGSWEWDLDSGEARWSDELYRIFGHEPGSIRVTYDTFLAALLPDDHDRVLAAINNTLIGKTPYDIEYRIVRPNGDVRVVHACGGVHRDATGHPLSMTGTVLDITERKQVEEALRASEERWQLAVRGSNDGIWDWDIQTGNVFFSSRWRAMRGFEDHEITNHVDERRSRIHPDDLDRVLQRIDAYLAKQTPEFSEEYRIQRKDGSYRWILDRGVALWADDGTPLRMVGSESDITEHRQALLRLAEQESLLRSILDAEPECVMRVAVDGTILQMNEAGLCFIEADSFEQMAGRSLYDLVDPEFLERYRSLHEAVIRGASQQLEFQIIGLKGTRRWMETHAVPLRNPIGHQVEHLAITRDITERKRAEEAVQMSERRYATLLGNLNGMAYRCRNEKGWTMDYVSEGCLALVGYPAEDLLGNAKIAFGDLVHPDDREWLWEKCAAHLRDHRACSNEYRILTAGGTVKWVWDQAQGIYSDTGELLTIEGFATDITERKHAEEAMRTGEERLRLSLEAANQGIYDLNVQTGEALVSSGYVTMLDYDPATFRETNAAWIERLHPDDRGRVADHYKAYIAGKIPEYRVEFRQRTRGGDWRWILSLGRIVERDARGEPLRMLGTHTDITEQKQTQEALVQSERQMRTVLDALPVGVWFTDRAGKPLFGNPAAKEIWSNIKQIGLQTPDSQASWRETIEPANEPHRWALSRVLTTGVPSLGETFTLECLDGTKKVIRNSTVPVQDEAGVVLGAIVLNEDITMLRQAQAALQLTQFSVDHAVEGFIWIGPDARIFHVNDSACRMLEYTYDELMTMTLHDIDPNLSSEVWPAHWEELKQKQSMSLETKYWSRTGRVLDTEVTFNYLQYEGREYNCAIMRDIGERRQGEEALRRSEERFRLLLEGAPLGITLLDGHFRYVKANQAFCDLVGYREEEIIGHTYALFTHPDDLSSNLSLSAEAYRGERASYQLEKRYIRKDNQTIWVKVNATSFTLPGNTDHHMIVIIEDITERKQLAEREASHVRQLKKLYELSMTLSGDPGVVLEHVVRIIGELFNVQVVCLSEIVNQELYFKSVYVNGRTLMDAGHCPLAITPCATVEQTKDLRMFDRVMERFPQASFLRDHLASFYCGFPSLDNEGRVVAVTCLLDNKPHKFSKEEQDLLRIFGQRIAAEIERGHHVAEQKQGADELRRSHAFIRQIVDTDPNFIFAKDREGRFILVNKAVANAYGSTVEELIGKTDADFNSNPDEVESFRLKDLEVMDSLQERFISEETITDSTGRIRWLQTVKRPILDEHGCATIMLGASTDITERKRMEETLRQRERDLRAALQERERISQDLHDGILQSLFAVGLALESSKLMMSPRVRKKAGASLDQAISQLNRVMHEIRNFIAGLGSDPLQGEDLPMALKHMLASLTEHQATRVRLAVEGRAAKSVSAEQSLHLFLVIQEAVSNCIQHGHAQEARVSLKMLKQGVRLSIRDNGRGFNPDAAKGTGHGLSNMAARAQKIGGRFTVLSKVKEGTSIVLDIPKGVPSVSR